jgi:hypothetical protein
MDAVRSMQRPDMMRLFDGLPWPVLVLSPNFVMVAANAAYYQNARLTPERVLGKPLQRDHCKGRHLRRRFAAQALLRGSALAGAAESSPILSSPTFHKPSPVSAQKPAENRHPQRPRRPFPQTDAVGAGGAAMSPGCHWWR